MLGSIEHLVDSLKARLRRRYRINQLQIVVYPGFRNESQVFVRGRVLVGKEIEGGCRNHGWMRNFGNMCKRFLSAEIPHARLELEWEGRSKEVTTDHEGFFFECLPCGPEDPLEVIIRTAEPRMREPFETRARIFGRSARSRFVVVSDIDDTVLLTMANKALRMMALTMFGNAHTRKPFAGVNDWYHQLRIGCSGHEENPLFYVSSSPWNLYDFLEEFLVVNGIPLGPMFLRDHGFEQGQLTLRDHRSHKLESIEQLMQAFPAQKFLLIGDSGQKDPEIYREIAQRHPDRIVGIMIRNVTPFLRLRLLDVERMGREIAAAGNNFLFFERTEQAVKATREWGLTSDSPVAPAPWSAPDWSPVQPSSQ
ncbi:MAG: Phosphatidate phosphatase APP1 [Verrucomicrobia bacterium]|jgi:phosphatidate phosphatase APP1|nr:MAG: Phosphatidate phosphatase APP1 [Verrucomicrobiota bacterium]